MEVKIKSAISLSLKVILLSSVITMPGFFGTGGELFAKKDKAEKKTEKKATELSSADLKLQAAVAKANGEDAAGNKPETTETKTATDDAEAGEAKADGDSDEAGEDENKEAVVLKNKGASGSGSGAPAANTLGTRSDEDRVSFWGTLFKTLLVLGLISAALFYGIRFFAKKQGFQPLANDMVDTLARVSLQPGKHMHIVEVGGKVLVLGVTDQNISLLSQVEDSDWVDELKMARSRNASKPTPNFWGEFAEQFIANFSPSPKGAPKPQAPPAQGFGDLIQKQRDRLQKLRGEGES